MAIEEYAASSNNVMLRGRFTYCCAVRDADASQNSVLKSTKAAACETFEMVDSLRLPLSSFNLIAFFVGSQCSEVLGPRGSGSCAGGFG